MFNQIPPVCKLCDIKMIEQITLTNRVALHFTPNGRAAGQPCDLTGRDLLERTTQAANLFNGLGLGRQETVSYIPKLITAYEGEKPQALLVP